MELHYRNFINRIVESNDYRLWVQTIVTCLIFGVLGAIMFSINLMIKSNSMMWITGAISVSGIGLALLSYKSRQFRTTRILITIVYMAALITFLYNGGIDGFSPFWACILPFMAFFIYGVWYGVVVSLVLLLIIVGMLWSPIFSMLDYTYTDTFILRFPILYFGCFVAAFSTEFVRHSTFIKFVETNEALESLTRVDTLTGIENRYAFETRINETWQLFYERENPLSVLIIDIDYFKKYNDAYGHLAGDQVLKQAAILIADVMADFKGYVSRWGGEEFICLLPFADTQKAVAIADQVLAVFRHAKIPHRETLLENKVITVSIGSATVYETKVVDTDAVIHGADESLYEAKESGRNAQGSNRSLS